VLRPVGTEGDGPLGIPKAKGEREFTSQ